MQCRPDGDGIYPGEHVTVFGTQRNEPTVFSHVSLASQTPGLRSHSFTSWNYIPRHRNRNLKVPRALLKNQLTFIDWSTDWIKSFLRLYNLAKNVTRNVYRELDLRVYVYYCLIFCSRIYFEGLNPENYSLNAPKKMSTLTMTTKKRAWLSQFQTLKSTLLSVSGGELQTNTFCLSVNVL